MRSLAALAVSALVLSGLFAPAPAQAAEALKVTLVQAHPTVGVGEEVFLYAVPRHLGYFRDEGLEVALQQSSGGTAAIQVLQSGTAEFATTLPESVLQAREQGGDPIAFYSLRRDGGHLIGVVPDSPIRTLADLKGKTIGAASWGSGGPKLLMHSLLDIGIGPAEYTRVVTGTGAAAAVALQSKQVDALALWDSLFAAMENQGMHFRYLKMPLDRKLGGFAVATDERFLKAHPEAVAGMCRAVNKALYFTRLDPEAAIRVFLEEFPALRTPNVPLETEIKNDARILVSWLDNSEYGVGLEDKMGNFLPETWEFTATYYKSEGTLNGTVPAASGYTNRFIDGCNDFDRGAVAAAVKKYETAP